MFAAASLFLPVARVLASDVETLAVDLFRQNRDPEFGELAGFVIRGMDGALELVPWPAPPKTLRRAANWYGPLPDRLVAVIHTHPRDLPRPSSQDAAEARRLGIPFYVVSARSLCVAPPGGLVSCQGLGTPQRRAPDVAGTMRETGRAVGAPG